METKSEDKPASVETAGAERFVRFPKRAGEAQDRWKWVERTVWTKRMLERLAQSEGQTVWYPNRWFTEHGLFSLLSARVRGSNP